MVLLHDDSYEKHNATYYFERRKHRGHLPKIAMHFIIDLEGKDPNLNSLNRNWMEKSTIYYFKNSV